MKISKKRILHEGRFLRLAEIEGISPSGIPFRWEIVERTNSKGIVVVVPVKEGPSTVRGTQGGTSFPPVRPPTVTSPPRREFVFVRHWRPAVEGWVMEFPAGLNDRDETLEEVARRELIEETGYLAERFIPLGTFPASGGISSEKLTCYLALNLTQIGKRELEPLEELEVIEIPFDSVKEELEDLRRKGNYIDLKVYALIEMARELLK